MPRHQEHFDRINDVAEENPHHAERDKAGENQRHIEKACTAKQKIAKACIGTDKFPDNRSGCRKYCRDLQSRKNVYQRRGYPHVTEGLPGCRPHRARQIEDPLVQCPKAGHAGHKGGKETQQKRQQDFGEQAEAEPHDKQRGNGNFGDELEKDDDRINRLFQNSD